MNMQTPRNTREPLDSAGHVGPIGSLGIHAASMLDSSYFRSNPQVYKGSGEASTVDKVLLTSNDETHLTVKVWQTKRYRCDSSYETHK